MRLPEPRGSSTGEQRQLALIDRGCRVRERLADILDFKIGILLNDPSFGHPLRDEADDGSHRNTQTPYARHSAHLGRIGGDSLKPHTDMLSRPSGRRGTFI